MKIHQPYRRLFHLWGKIDRQHNEYLAAHITGNRILDIGCGYGSCVNFLSQKGYEAIGIDNDKTCLEIATRLFPQAHLKQGNAETLDFPDSSFDAVILKDAMHHIYHETDTVKAMGEIWRVLKQNGRLLIFDPNPTLILKTARMIIAHKDPECPWQQARDCIEQIGFSVIHLSFYESIGIALSGGYVGLPLVPNMHPLHRIIMLANHSLSNIINTMKLGRYILWRYLIIGVKTHGS